MNSKCIDRNPITQLIKDSFDFQCLLDIEVEREILLIFSFIKIGKFYMTSIIGDSDF